MTAERRLALAMLVLAVAAALLSYGCAGKPKPQWAVQGDAARGERLVAQVGCGACHEIPGVRGAAGRVGPPLEKFGSRTVVAGVLPNTPENLERWLMNPQQVVPGNAMPSTGLQTQDARDVAAFLYTLT